MQTSFLIDLSCAVFCRIYYQNHEYITVPTSCAGMFDSTADATLSALYTCPGLAALATSFTASDCSDSFAKVCQAEYTDNPPYSCTKTNSPDFLTTLGSALANASAMWSFTAILFALTLKRIYPGGIVYRTYKENHHRVYKPADVVPLHSDQEIEAEEAEAEEELDKVPTEA